MYDLIFSGDELYFLLRMSGDELVKQLVYNSFLNESVSQSQRAYEHGRHDLLISSTNIITQEI
jgi:hypothetical protein